MIKSKKLSNKHKNIDNKKKSKKQKILNKKKKKIYKKKLNEYILKGGDLLTNISGSNTENNETNSMVDNILGKNKKNESLVTRIIRNISLPSYFTEKSVTTDSKQIVSKKNLEEKNEKQRMIEVLKKKEQGDTDYFDEEMVLAEERKLAQEDKKREMSNNLGKSGLFSGITKRLSQQFSDTEDNFTGLNKKRALEMDKVKNLSRTKNCSPLFVSGLDTLLGTCAKKELVNIYNKIIKRLKDPDLLFSYEIKEQINELQEINFNDKLENDIDTNVNVVDLNKKVDNDNISKLEKLTEKELLKELEKKSK